MKLDKVDRNTLANYLGAGFSAFMGIAFIPVYIAYLGRESFALVGFVALMQSWASIIDGGISAAVGRNISRYQSDERYAPWLANLMVSCEYVFFGIASVFLFVGVLIGTAEGWYWQEVGSIPVDKFGVAIFLIFLITGFRVLEGFYRSALLAMERQVVLNVWLVCSAALKAGGAIIGLKFYDWDIVNFFQWQVFVTVAYCLILRSQSLGFFFKEKCAGSWSLQVLLESKKFIGGVAIINITALLLAQLDKLYLSGNLSLGDLGMYMFCSTVASALSLLMYPVSQAFYPRFCEHYRLSDTAAFSSDFHKSSQIVTIISGSVIAWFTFFAEEILSLWTSDLSLAEESSIIVVILLAGNYFSGMNLIPQHAQLAAGKTSVIQKTNIAVLLVYTPIMFIGFSSYGIVGVAASWLFIHVLYNVIVITLVHKVILPGHWRQWLINDNFYPLCAMFAISWFASLLVTASVSGLVAIATLSMVYLIIITTGVLFAPRVKQLVYGS